MTNFAITPSASGTGTVTLTVPEINTVNTVALPVISGGTLLENTNPTVNQLNGGQLAGFRNKIINGKMEISQRAASFSTTTGNATIYTLDRYRIDYKVSAATTTITQQSDAPSPEFQNSLRVTVTANQISFPTTDQFFEVMQIIEGYNVRDLIGRTFTLSFWVKSSKVGIHCVNFRNTVGDRNYVAEYTVAVANNWEFKTITVPGGLITAGGWNWQNGRGVGVAWALASTSGYNTTSNSWQPGTFVATANQVNLLDTVGNIFAITGVQLEAGSVATPFEHRLFSTELTMCQRYYEKSYDITTPPGTITTIGQVRAVSINGPDFYTQGYTPFKTPKRTTPIMQSYNPVTGTSNTYDNNGTSRSAVWLDIGTNSARLNCSTSDQFVNVGCGWQWAANAEL